MTRRPLDSTVLLAIPGLPTTTVHTVLTYEAGFVVTKKPSTYLPANRPGRRKKKKKQKVAAIQVRRMIASGDGSRRIGAELEVNPGSSFCCRGARQNRPTGQQHHTPAHWKKVYVHAPICSYLHSGQDRHVPVADTGDLTGSWATSAAQKSWRDNFPRDPHPAGPGYADSCMTGVATSLIVRSRTRLSVYMAARLGLHVLPSSRSSGNRVGATVAPRGALARCRHGAAQLLYYASPTRKARTNGQELVAS